MEEKREHLIYCHTSPSGKKYIGQTKNYNKRCTPSNYKGSSIFYLAIQKYGWNSFKHEILKDSLTLKEANNLEEYYIKEYNTLTPNGYNLQLGGNNKLVTNEAKRNISKSAYNRYYNPDKNDNFIVNEELLIKAKNNNNAKRYKITSPSGEIINIYGTLKYFCKEYNLNYTRMITFINNKNKKDYYRGYKCEKIINE